MANVREQRYLTLLPVEKIIETPITIIGCGAIGRQAALALSIMGVKQLFIYDDDVVSIENFGCQGYRPEQLGQLKVDALSKDLLSNNPEIKITKGNFKVDKEHPLINKDEAFIIFCCVDSISAREYLWKTYGIYCTLWIDARMAAEVAEIYTATPQSRLEYEKSFFPEEEAYQAPCTASSTFYNASIAGNIMIAQMTRFMRNRQIEPKLTIDIANMDLIV